jgi:hypothetical protein
LGGEGQTEWARAGQGAAQRAVSLGGLAGDIQHRQAGAARDGQDVARFELARAAARTRRLVQGELTGREAELAE